MDTNGSKGVAAAVNREELHRYLELFASAFDELHAAVVKQVNVPGQYIGPHNDYPIRSLSDSGFAVFHEMGFYRDSAPKDYVGTVRPRGLGGLLGGIGRHQLSLPRGAELAAFLRTHEIGKRISLARRV